MKFIGTHKENDAIDAQTLAQLAAHPLVNGLLLDLDGSQTLRDAYAQWDAQPASPLAANVVANKIKSLLFTTAPSYPALKYLVVIGDDRVIPHARLRDDALHIIESNAVIAVGREYQPFAEHIQQIHLNVI